MSLLIPDEVQEVVTRGAVVRALVVLNEWQQRLRETRLWTGN